MSANLQAQRLDALFQDYDRVMQRLVDFKNAYQNSYGFDNQFDQYESVEYVQEPEYTDVVESQSVDDLVSSIDIDGLLGDVTIEQSYQEEPVYDAADINVDDILNSIDLSSMSL